MDLSQIPAGHPPPGLKPNFTNPSPLQTPVIILSTIFLSLATMMVILRVYTRRFLSKLLSWSDGRKRHGINKQHTDVVISCLRTCAGEWDRDSVYISLHIVPDRFDYSFRPPYSR